MFRVIVSATVAVIRKNLGEKIEGKKISIVQEIKNIELII